MVQCQTWGSVKAESCGRPCSSPQSYGLNTDSREENPLSSGRTVPYKTF